jgi:serine/threonine-protein kinase RsbT
MSRGRTVPVAGDVDVAAAAREARGLAVACGLSGVEAQHVATAVSEVARNAVKYADGGVVELVPAQSDGRRGLRVTVRDRGPGIADLAGALRDGVSTGGSLGLGLPGARRLMDDFAIRSGPGGTGARAAAVAGSWRTRPWHAPAQLADRARAELDPGERLGLAIASVSALDGRLAWLRAGSVGCVLLRRDSELVVFPPAAVALSRRGGGALRAATVDVRRDDVLVMAAAPLDPPALAELALRGGGPGEPAFVSARFERGTLEPRRPRGGLERRSTLERP